MLELKKISKQYKTGDFVQNALNEVSLCFRDNEFVAVLGPSGSGKTTLLNILGGLDRYSSGDLLINGVSTKQFKDRDWDSYRNHSVGFVFQNYQLIPHQSVLENVELALAISGIPGAERRKRAERALREVGLEEHIHKNPTQLSGGQMQRVAIARALVNEPDIVLADEPTGALDSATSIQVMDLLKEVAKDRLVIMVTHNPELAKTYATRIVKIRDGKIYEDSMPYEPRKEEQKEIQKKPAHVSMSFLTALTLSFNNLRTKKARTFLVSFAGSIGIIGIALILALSSGVNRYIKEQEEETLSAYPVQIEKTGYNLSSLMSGRNSTANPRTASADDSKKDKVGVNDMTDTIFNGVSNNDLASMKKFLDDGGDGIKEYSNGIEYRYDITPEIYSLDSDGKARQVNPNNMFASLATGKMDISSVMSGTMGSDFFQLLPSVRNLYEDTYEVKAGHWPEKSDELVLILSADGKVSDLVLYALNLKDGDELEKKVEDFSEGKTVAASSSEETGEEEWYDYDDFLGKTFRLVYNDRFYQYDSEYNVWVDKSEDESYVNSLIPDSKELKITGIVQPKEGTNVSILQDGIGYTDLLVRDIMQEAAGSRIVQDQIANPDKNVLTGKDFDEENSEEDIDFTKLFQLDEDALKDAFQNSFDASGFDASDLNIDSSSLQEMLSGGAGDFDLGSLNLGDVIDPSALSSAIPSMDAGSLSDLLGEVKFNISAEKMEELFKSLLNGYLASVQDDPAANPAGLSDALKSYLGSSEFRQLLQEEFQKILSGIEPVSREDLEDFLGEILSGYPQYVQDNGLDAANFENNLKSYLASEETREKMENAAAALTDRFQSLRLGEDQLKEIGTDLLGGYQDYAKANSLPDVESIGKAFQNYLAGDSAKQMIMDSVSDMIDTGSLEQKIAEMFQSSMQNLSSEIGNQVTRAFSAIMQSVTSEIAKSMNAAMTQVMSQLQDQMGSMFQMDPSALADAIQINMSSGEIQDLMNSLMQTQESSYDNNLSAMGYADLSNPSSIYIYPKDFESKQEIADIISDYNDRMEEEGHSDRVIVYTDMVATLMSSITRVINTISYVLIAFVAISLVVSSIMIGVITYISVLERKNEIGILRAVGASKRNVGEVFNAETFIIGLLAGLIGVGLTLILLFPTNALIASYTQQNDIHAYLKPVHALLLVLLSTGLTMLAGIVPSRKAARSDPVAALRSE